MQVRCRGDAGEQPAQDVLVHAAAALSEGQQPGLRPRFAPPLIYAAAPAERVNLVNAIGAQLASLPAARLHDYFNIGSISGLVALTLASHVHRPLNFPLAIAVFTYTALDTVWVALQPHAVEEPSSILGHHLMALVVSAHAVTWAPHTHYTSWMSIVEINTLILMLKRHVPTSFRPFMDLAFKVTWVATRVIWFPILAVYLSLLSTWPTALRRYVCTAGLYGLALLQWAWTLRGEKPEDDTMREDVSKQR